LKISSHLGAAVVVLRAVPLGQLLSPFLDLFLCTVESETVQMRLLSGWCIREHLVWILTYKLADPSNNLS
jgi:hypothetical protein